MKLIAHQHLSLIARGPDINTGHLIGFKGDDLVPLLTRLAERGYTYVEMRELDGLAELDNIDTLTVAVAKRELGQGWAVSFRT